MTSILPDDALDELPSGYNQVGHVGTALRLVLVASVQSERLNLPYEEL